MPFFMHQTTRTYLRIKKKILFLVVVICSYSKEFRMAEGPLPSLQSDRILSLRYSLVTIVA